MTDRSKIRVRREGEWEQFMVPVALADLPVDVNAKLVLVWLCRYANRDGRCWPSVGRLATDCSLSKATVTRALATLEDKGALRKESGKEKGATNQYVIIKWWGTAAGATPPVDVTDVEQKQDGFLGELLGGDAVGGTRVVPSASPGGAPRARGNAVGGTEVDTISRSMEVVGGGSAAPTPHQRIMDHFSHAFEMKHGFRPILGAVAGKQLKPILAARGEAEVLQVIDTWFSTSDPWPAKCGYKMAAMLSAFDAIKLLGRERDRPHLDPGLEGVARRFLERRKRNGG